jgi:hypothetical protein
MTWAQILAWGSAVAYGLVYLTAVTAIGYATQNGLAWKLSLTALGLCFLTFALQVVEPQWKTVNWRTVAGTCAACSITAGAIAGFALLVK